MYEYYSLNQLSFYILLFVITLKRDLVDYIQASSKLSADIEASIGVNIFSERHQCIFEAQSSCGEEVVIAAERNNVNYVHVDARDPRSDRIHTHIAMKKYVGG